MGNEMIRKLASVQVVAEVKPIEGADSVCAYRINGWWVVDSIGKYRESELVCFIEPDAWLPHELAPFLSKGKLPREYNGIKGERLRSIKLRGALSQGLVLPFSVLPELTEFNEGDDVTALLGITKWEKPVSIQLQGAPRGNFPDCIPKTDQERIQNIPDALARHAAQIFQVTTKLDGSSMTIASIDGQWHVCSRNIDLDLTQAGNAFIDTARRYILIDSPDAAAAFGNLAIQGELMGPGIQGNREKLTEHEFFVFDIFNIDTQGYMPPQDVSVFCEVHGLAHVPVLGHICPELHGITELDQVLHIAEGHSINNPVREGIVFKSCFGQRISFKAISNTFLLGDD